MTPDQAIEAANLVEAETRYLHQLAREAYEAGHADGFRAGYRQADADQAARWNQHPLARDSAPARMTDWTRSWVEEIAMNGFVGRWRKAVDAIKDQLEMPGPNMRLDREPVLIRDDRSRPPAEAVLDPDAQHKLAPTWKQPSPEFSEIFVLLAEARGGDEKHVEIYINEDRLGTLTAADSQDFLAILAAADGQPVMGQAIRDRDSDGGWALHIYRPQSS